MGLCDDLELPTVESQRAIQKWEMTSRKTLNGRADRAEKKTKTHVRIECVDRDNYCRTTEMMRDVCQGPSEWSHIEPRSATRGMAPDRRHSTRTSMMLCRKHHQQLDAHLWDPHFIDDDKGADGPIEVRYR